MSNEETAPIVADRPPPVTRWVNPNDLVKSPHHRRTNWGDRRAFTKGIVENGIMQNIVCRIPKDNPNGLEIVFGHRRHDGAVNGKLDKILIEIRDMTDKEVIEALIRENADREDAHPLDEAALFAQLIERGEDVKSLARMFDRGQSEIRDCLALLSLTPKVRKAYGDGALTDYQAQKISRLTTPAQQVALWQAIRDGHIKSDHDIRSWIRQHALIALSDVEWDLGDKSMPKPDGKQGSCNDCGLRTSKQPDLFPDIASAVDLCAMPKCWRVKMDHAYQHAVARAEADGIDVIDRSPDLTFIPAAGIRPRVTRSSGYVDPDAESTVLPGVTWEAAAAKAGVTPTRELLRDQEGRPRVLYTERSVAVPIRTAIKTKPESQAAKAEVAVDPARAAARVAKLALQAEEAALLKAIVQTDEFEPSLILALVASRVVSMSSVRAVAKASGIAIEKILSGEVEHPQADGVLLALLVAEIGIATRHPEVAAVAAVVGQPLEPIDAPPTDAA